MYINTNQVVSISEANQNFSKVVRIVDREGQAVVFKNNKPKYMVVSLDENPMLDLTADEKIDIAAKRILEKYLPAFKELAK